MKQSGTSKIEMALVASRETIKDVPRVEEVIVLSFSEKGNFHHSLSNWLSPIRTLLQIENFVNYLYNPLLEMD